MQPTSAVLSGEVLEESVEHESGSVPLEVLLLHGLHGDGVLGAGPPLGRVVPDLIARLLRTETENRGRQDTYTSRKS